MCPTLEVYGDGSKPKWQWMSGHVRREHFPSRQINFVFFWLLNYLCMFLTAGWTLAKITKSFEFNSRFVVKDKTHLESCVCKEKLHTPSFLQLCLNQSLLMVFLSECLKPDFIIRAASLFLSVMIARCQHLFHKWAQISSSALKYSNQGCTSVTSTRHTQDTLYLNSNISFQWSHQNNYYTRRL